ncbi:MAG: cation transporter [Gammaproteobacteria bacterium]|nr:cation transporter [Gammaproteobacteria bacterium]
MNRMTKHYPEVRKVTIVGLLVNLVLSVIKVMGGWLLHSQALVADGIHSLSDLITDFMVLYAAKHSHREADENHPYGHGRIETLATVALGILLLLVAIGIAYDAVSRLFHPETLLIPGALTLVIAIISVLSKEALYWYTMNAANKVRSPILKANAWHHRSDAISSIVVLVGILGTMSGLAYLDAIAAVGVALMIAKIAIDLGMNSLYELIDTALNRDEVNEIRAAILNIYGVRSLHMLRSRRSGGDVLIDLHLQVDSTLSVSEGHQIGEAVRLRLQGEFEDISDVTVHIDPEDDEENSPSEGLPLRAEVTQDLQKQWSGIIDFDQIKKITLHYLSGKVHIDVVLPIHLLDNIESADDLSSQLVEKARELVVVGEVKVYYR